MSPRRSSRARTTGPGPQHTANNSSSSQSRFERSTRSHNKRETSSAQQSDSGDQSPNGRGDPLATRRSKRGTDVENDDNLKTTLGDEEEESAEAEEITRCVCGLQEYPGPPAAARDSGHRGSKAGIKDENGVQPAPETFAEDAGNFFIQCDKCQVWQHGGCVGLMDESMSPDEYYCEQCKPSSHKIIRGPNGSKSTRYLPVLEAVSTRSSPTSSSSDLTQDKEAKQKTKEANTRRRATMNSRDAAYDEEEMMRRAIEESKMTSGTLGKRGREESEDKTSTSKRMRTSSASPEPKASPPPSHAASGDEEESKTTVNGNTRRARGAATRPQREKETKEKQKEAEKQKKDEGPNKRNPRTERRRGEDSPPPTPSLSPSKQEAKSSAPSAQKLVPPDTPSSHRPGSSNNHRKTGRPPARRGRMRSQYAREAHLNGDDSPMRDGSRDGRGSPHGANGFNGDTGRPSRPKYLNPNRTSLNEMKRRVAGIIEFVSRLQTEGPSSSSSGGANTPNGTVHGNSEAASPTSIATDPAKKIFREMNSTDMMEELMRGALTWQTTYGKYGEK